MSRETDTMSINVYVEKVSGYLGREYFGRFGV